MFDFPTSVLLLWSRYCPVFIRKFFHLKNICIIVILFLTTTTGMCLRMGISSTSQMLSGLSFAFRLLGCFPFILFSSNLEIIKFQDWKGGALIQQFASAHCIPPVEPTKVGYFFAIKNTR